MNQTTRSKQNFEYLNSEGSVLRDRYQLPALFLFAVSLNIKHSVEAIVQESHSHLHPIGQTTDNHLRWFWEIESGRRNCEQRFEISLGQLTRRKFAKFSPTRIRTALDVRTSTMVRRTEAEGFVVGRVTISVNTAFFYVARVLAFPIQAIEMVGAVVVGITSGRAS